MRTSVFQRIAVMAVIFVMLLVPLMMIYSLIWERTARRDEAAREISSQWGAGQRIIGPILTVPFEFEITHSDGRRETGRDQASFLPLALVVEARVTPELRKRGLFGVPVYRAAVTITGRFRQPDLRQVFSGAGEMKRTEARIGLVLSDPRGIAGPVQLTVGGTRLEVMPGLADTAMGSSGVAANLPSLEAEGDIPFQIAFEINGTRSFELLPVGNDTRVSIDSTWQHPGFTGIPLPYSHSIDAAGFHAEWNVAYFGRGFPTSWRAGTLNRDRFSEAFQNAAFGVTLVQPVDIYQQTTRAVKYAALFIVLTFVIAFLWEIVGGVLVHPIQYVFIGFALCLFYVLLLAFSEHAPFDRAYLAASGPTVLLIGWYWQWIVRARGRTLIMFAALTALYGYLYLLLRLEDFALLAGAIGLFVVLGTVMFLTRRVNWYDLRVGGDRTPETAIEPTR